MQIKVKKVNVKLEVHKHNHVSFMKWGTIFVHWWRSKIEWNLGVTSSTFPEVLSFQQKCIKESSDWWMKTKPFLLSAWHIFPCKYILPALNSTRFFFPPDLWVALPNKAAILSSSSPTFFYKTSFFLSTPLNIFETMQYTEFMKLLS